MIRVPLRRASSLALRLPTRKQNFKDHLCLLRESDPERWTSRTLAYHFRLPLANVEALLALQALEAEAKAASALDPKLVKLAEDAEEYLDSEYDEPLPPPRQPPNGSASAQVFFDEEAAAPEDPADPAALEHLSHAQELALINAVAVRFGGGAARPGVGSGEALGAAVREAIESLTLDELLALEGEVRASGAATAAEATEDNEPARQRVRRSLLDALTSDAPATLLEQGEGDDFAALGLPDAPRTAPAAPAAPSSGSTAGVDGLGTWKPPPDAFWVDGTTQSPTMNAVAGRGGGGVRPDGTVAKRLVPGRETVDTWRAAERSFGRPESTSVMLGVATTPEELRLAREPDFGDRMRDNLEKRARRLSADQPGSNTLGQPANAGRIVFTEVVRPHKKVPIAARVWVSQKRGGAREPTERELRDARLRVQPPIMVPRIKRNQ